MTWYRIYSKKYDVDNDAAGDDDDEEYLGDKGGSLSDDKHDDDGYEHDGDLVFVSVGGQPVTRQLTDHLGSHLSSGTQRDDHLTTENRQRRHGNNKHDDGVE